MTFCSFLLPPPHFNGMGGDIKMDTLALPPSHPHQRHCPVTGGGSIQNVLQEGVGVRHTITGSTIMMELRIQLLTEVVTYFGLVSLILMLTPDLQHGQCSCRQ
jgi:hypothetical protein